MKVKNQTDHKNTKRIQNPKLKNPASKTHNCDVNLIFFFLIGLLFVYLIMILTSSHLVMQCTTICFLVLHSFSSPLFQPL